MSHSSNVKLRSLIDGSNPSAAARAFRLFALPFSITYSLIVRGRNFAYDIKLVKSQRASRPVVSIGNITMGGVGKTPFVAWLTDYITSLGKNVALISRGYKAKAQQGLLESQREFFDSLSWVIKSRAIEPESRRFFHFNDEACELALRFPETPYFLDSSRIEAAKAVTRLAPETDALILDDAFQHRQISRDLDVVLLDALLPFGGGRVAPAGYLREPVSEIKRADVVVLNRADLISNSKREEIKKCVVRYAPRAIWCEIAQRPSFIMRRMVESDGVRLRREDFSQWQTEFHAFKPLAFCGLGAPQGFKETLLAARFPLASFMTFPDHCVYSRDDFLAINQAANDLNADVVITTMKDFVKLSGREPIDKPVVALGIDVVFLTGETEFKQALQNVLNAPYDMPNKK